MAKYFYESALQSPESVALGVDIGGTNTAFGFVDRRGRLLARGSVSTRLWPSAPEFVDALYEAAQGVWQRAGLNARLVGVGVGAPAANYFTGEIENAVNLPWGKNLPMAKIVAARFGLETRLVNDANAAALGEMTYGAGRGMRNFIMLTLGTGIGSGIVADGKLLYGVGALAGELGHVIVERHGGRKCACGRSGCLETYCSAEGVRRTALLRLGEPDCPSSILKQIPAAEITSKVVAEAAAKGDKVALDVLNFTGAVLGRACANFVAFSAPEAIILFGGLAKAGDLLLRPLREAFEADLLFLYKGRVSVLLSSLKEADAALLGASAIAWECDHSTIKV